MEGLMAVMGDQKQSPEVHETLPFKVTSGDLESLLVDLLNEALFIMQTHKVTIKQMEFSTLEPTLAEGYFTVIPVTGFADDVKAVTYHAVKIQHRSDGGLETIIVLDI